VKDPAVAREAWWVQAEDAERTRQEEGMAALIEIAIQTPWSVADTTPIIISNAPPSALSSVSEDYSAQYLGDTKAHECNATTSMSKLWLLVRHVRSDHLVRNSLYLMLSSGIQAALGFMFWIIMARLYSTGDVGRASSLISATALIAYLSLFGLNSTLVRFLPTARNKASLITAAFVLVACTGATIGLCYIVLTPAIAPRLAFVAHRLALTAGFVLLTAAAAVNLLSDSVFVASRKAGFCALTDGVAGGISKIVFGLILVGTGAYGLFCASAGGFAAAALASIVLIVTTFHWRPSLKEPFQALKPLLRFSGANYVANVLNLVPTLIIPLITLDRLGAEAAAFYFVAFQMATLLYSAVWAVESAFLAEGSQAEADWQAVRKRSRRLAIILFVPGAAFLALTAHWVLLAFGSRYSQHGTMSLVLLAIAVIPIAACNWSWTVLRLSGRLTALVVSSGVYSGAISGFAWILAPHGLAALTAAWPVGSAVSAAIAALLSPMVPRKMSGRHRRTT
jgi:O-antigen/teichoic acid export membrane protein